MELFAKCSRVFVFFIDSNKEFLEHNNKLKYTDFCILDFTQGYMVSF